MIAEMCKECSFSPRCKLVPGGTFCTATKNCLNKQKEVEVNIPDGRTFGTLTLKGEQVEVYCGSFTQETIGGITKRKFTFIEV